MKIQDIILEAREVSKSYKSGVVKVEALKQCHIQIHRGEFTAVIGKSGSGKSTLLRALGGLNRPDTGTVVIDGKDIFQLKDREMSQFRRRKIGFVYQDYRLLPEFTAFENIIMPYSLDNRAFDEEQVMELMKTLEIEECRRKFPSQMSGGEQQRTAIARAMVMQPAVIFADEPTGNLDAASAKIVAELLSLASQKYNQTIIMVTHDKQMADYADRLITITDGVVTE